MNEIKVNISGAGDCVLEGRIAFPHGTAADVPCVVLLHPWGAWDMDGSLDAELSLDDQPIQLFTQLRDILLASGVAVLRYNSRFIPGADGTKPLFADRTFSNHVQDAEAAVRLVRQMNGIDPKRVLLLGISLGTEVALAVAERDSRLYGLLLLAAIGENFKQRLYYMNVERRLEWLLEQGMSDEHGWVDLAALKACHTERWGWWELSPELEGAERMPFEQVAAVLKHHHELYQARLLREGDHEAPAELWREWMNNEHPWERIARYKGYVLIATGDDDNTTPVREAYLLLQALEGRANVQFKLFPNCGHIFSPRKQNGRRTYGPLDEQVLRYVSDYVKQICMS